MVRNHSLMNMKLVEHTKYIFWYIYIHGLVLFVSIASFDPVDYIDTFTHIYQCLFTVTGTIILVEINSKEKNEICFTQEKTVIISSYLSYVGGYQERIASHRAGNQSRCQLTKVWLALDQFECLYQTLVRIHTNIYVWCDFRQHSYTLMSTWSLFYLFDIWCFMLYNCVLPI